ncbi:MAG: N-acetyl-gamma-glutamyl-phosphate reductase [Kiritimatiellae bacterium]|nr:N-acetyl-gamma-glutamyl-phosphate reductase [Kiritimatiellia bacterium]
MKKIFIDGSAGTTGLRIRDRLAGRADVSLVTLPEELRKDPAARAEALNAADVAFLCLPDAAAVEAVALLDPANDRTVVIDTSTAHRTAPGWDYGFPELPGAREKIARSRRIANPGCHASGFVALVAPLLRAGLVAPGTPLSCFSLTGYTGGGKKMIAQYEGDAAARDPLLGAPRQYGLSQAHKHLPEMVAMTGIGAAPAFCPVVADFPCGMEVTVPLFARDVGGASPEAVAAVYRAAYPETSLVRFRDAADESGFLSASAFAGRDDMEISLHGNAERMVAVARFDNLGKGASGAAIQNMNVALGLPETTGLELGA